jgi:hypothetical protein
MSLIRSPISCPPYLAKEVHACITRKQSCKGGANIIQIFNFKIDCV